MYVEYINKAAIKDNGGEYQRLPGTITLQWDDAAIDKNTWEMLDVQLTIKDINAKVADYFHEDNKEKKKTFTRKEIEAVRFMLLVNETSWSSSGKEDVHSPGEWSPEIYYKESGIPSLKIGRFLPMVEINETLDHYVNYPHSLNFTVNFLNKDGTVNPGRYNTLIRGITSPGYVGSPGEGRESYDRTDRAQGHVKLLTPGDSLHVGSDTVLWTDKGTPKTEAWSIGGGALDQDDLWAIVNIRSGSTIETGMGRGMYLFEQLDPLISKMIVTKKGNGVGSGKTFPTGTIVNFTYEVKNIGVSKVSGIKATDSKGVKVTCPKKVLRPKEKMVCTGTGIVTSESIMPLNPGSGVVKDPSSLDDD